ncbi:MAG: NAD(P)-dependent alcohol dehydrogenase [bacterium]|nr:NAD(P)-dependent alcohol dehydrogenase [bacterium]
MKASVYRKYGPPDVLEIQEVEKPAPKDNEVLIKVHAATVNRSDCAMLWAKPFFMRFATGLFKPKNPILGTDFAGIIEAVGKDATLFNIGDKVFGFDDGGISSHAQYMTLAENNALTTMPDNIKYEEAAASIEGAHYAYNFINKVELKEGQKVLVNGATGAIGSAIVQLLKHFGIAAAAVCESKNADLVKSLGANKVIDYTKEDFTQSGEKYDFVFDTVGKSTFGKCKPLLVPGGIYISSELGPMAQNIFYSLFTPIFGGKKVIFPLPTDRPGTLRLIKKLTEEGKFKPLIDRTYSLEEIAEAFSYVEKGQKIGNVVIRLVEEK